MHCDVFILSVCLSVTHDTKQSVPDTQFIVVTLMRDFIMSVRRPVESDKCGLVNCAIANDLDQPSRSFQVM